MTPRAITFDIGGTLIEPWPSVGQVYAGVAADFGVEGIAPGRLTENFFQVWEASPDFDYSRQAWFEIVRLAFGEAAPLLPAEYYPAVYERFARADAWRIYDDVFPALEFLTQRGFQLGVVSNWDERLRPLLTELGLARYFSSLIISCEAGAEKPAARVFRLAAGELGVAADELLHIGDSYAKDIQGARNIGAAGFQVMRSGAANKSWQIRSLDELGALLDPARGQAPAATTTPPGSLVEPSPAGTRPRRGERIKSTHTPNRT